MKKSNIWQIVGAIVFIAVIHFGLIVLMVMNAPSMPDCSHHTSHEWEEEDAFFELLISPFGETLLESSEYNSSINCHVLSVEPSSTSKRLLSSLINFSLINSSMMVFKSRPEFKRGYYNYYY